MHFDSLLALASRRRWDEMMAALTRPENRPLCPEVVVKFEELGDRCLASGSLLDATRYFSAAITCAMLLLYAPASGEDPSWLAAPFTRLSEKGMDARRRFDEEHSADTSGPVEWTSGTDRIVELGLMGRFQEAGQLLARLDEANDRSSENHATCGRRLEAASDRSSPLQPEMAIWFLERALRRFELAKRLAPGGEADPACAADLDRLNRKLAVLRPPPAIPEPRKVKIPAPEPQVNLEALLRELEKLAREKRTSSWMGLLRNRKYHPFCRQIAERFEALGDEHRETGQSFPAAEFYRVAADAFELAKFQFAADGDLVRNPSRMGTESQRVTRKLQKLEEAILDEKIAHPVGSDFDPETLHLAHDMDSVELLVLARRFGEATRLLGKLWRFADADPVPPFLDRLEYTGDRLERKHPELARWFYEKFHDYATYIPGDRYDEAKRREAVIRGAAENLNRAKARLPKPRATIRLSLAGWGNPTGNCPDPQISSQTVANEGLLTLAPEWVFADYREEGGGVLRPEQWPGRYRFRVLVEGKQVQLEQTDDEYGRSQPFDLGEPAAMTDARRAPPFRLKIGEPVTIHCRVAGGGPEWTLTLSGFDEMPG